MSSTSNPYIPLLLVAVGWSGGQEAHLVDFYYLVKLESFIEKMFNQTRTPDVCF